MGFTKKIISTLLLVPFFLGAAELPLESCVIPTTGAHVGELPSGCSSPEKKGHSFGGESVARCKVLDVRCGGKTSSDYVATVEVEHWMHGKGEKRLEVEFIATNKLSLGKGLCADLSLEKSGKTWRLKKVHNPTSSQLPLPSCH